MNTLRTAALAAATCVALVAAAPAQAVVVSPDNPDGWAFAADSPTGAPATGAFVYGPAGLTPAGSLGSARLTTAGGSEGQVLGRPQPVATFAVLSGYQRLTGLNYRAYRIAAGPTNTISVQLNVDYDVTDGNNGWQGRLVYEPYNSGGVLTFNQWQTWTAIGNSAQNNAAKWWATGGAGAAQCPQSSPCTWTQVMSKFPKAGIHAAQGGIVLKAGSGWNEPFDGRVDNLNVVTTNPPSTAATTTTYDFEPERCTTDCYVDAANGDNGNSGKTPATATKTIGAAIARVSPGGTVHIAAGTYDEDVALNKAGVTLSGAGADDTIVRGPKGGAGDTIRVSQPNATIEDLTVTRDGNTADGWKNELGVLNGQGILIANVSGTTIRDTRLTGNRTAIYNGGAQGATNTKILRNDIDFNRTGIHVVNNATGMEVRNNFITDNWTIGLLIRDENNGVNVSQAITVEDNDVSGNWFSGIEARSKFTGPPAFAMTKNWYGSPSAPEVATGIDSGEPLYDDQIPLVFGGDKEAPLDPAPSILWNDTVNATNPHQFTPWRCEGTDDEPGTFGFQPTGDLAASNYGDSDRDGFGVDPSIIACGNAPGIATRSGDEDDADASIYPGAPELCDGKDNDQDGFTDEGATTTFYKDADGDGFGDPATAVEACAAPDDSYVTNGEDADDADDTVYPDAPELCDGKDNNQDDQVDEGVTTTYYRDADGDSLGDPAQSVQACEQPDGYVTNADDADDSHDDRYTIGAFHSPLSGSQVNSVKSGQNVPVKVTLTDSAGDPVTTDPGLTLSVDDCPADGDATALDVTWVHQGAGLWQANWKTPKGWTGCRTLVVDVNQVTDAQTATLQFK